MLPKKKQGWSRGKPLEAYARVAMRVNSYKVRAEAALNHNARKRHAAID